MTAPFNTWLAGKSAAASVADADLFPVVKGGVTYKATSPQILRITTLGDLVYGSGTNAASRLAGNTSATKKFLAQTGDGAASAAPGWSTLATADIPVPLNLTSAAASAFSIGPNGDTNPTLRVVTNVASAATGLSVTGNAAGAGVTLTVLSSGTDESLNLTPKGAGATVLPSASYLKWSTDLGLSRSSAAVLKIGNGSTGDGYLVTAGIHIIQSSNDGAGASFAFDSNGMYQLGSSARLTWSSGNASGGSADVGLSRNAAKVLEVNTGVAGTFASLTCGMPAVGTVGLTVQGAASRTVGLVHLQTSASGSLGNVGGCVFDHFADGATTHTDGTFDTLYTDTTVANTLAINGDKIEFDYTLSVVGHAISTDQIKVTFGGITIFDSGANNYAVGATINLRGRIVRASSTTCRATVEFFPAGSATILGFEQITYTPAATLTGMTLTGTNVLAVTAAATGTNSASGDVTGVMGSVDVIPAGS